MAEPSPHDRPPNRTLPSRADNRADAPTILVLGSSNTDLVVRGNQLPAPGETVSGGEFFRAAGGKGANQAVAAARAGAHVIFIGAVGDDDYGLTARTNLAADGIDLTHLGVHPGVASGIALIMVDRNGENQISVAAGANARLTVGDVERLPDELFTRAKLFLASLESPLDAVYAGLKRARAAGIATLLNPAPATRAIVELSMLPFVDAIVPNRHEAALLTGCDTQTDDGLAVAARKLCEGGCRSVIVTLGQHGCAVYDSRASLDLARIPAVPAIAVDTTGAGDTFCGALAVALAEREDLNRAAGWASHAAAISVTRPGAQPSIPHRREIEASIAADTNAHRWSQLKRP